MNNTLKNSWKEELNKLIPLLGHRNWIIVTDMAYPLQTQSGIQTIYTGEDFFPVLENVFRKIEKEPHIRPLIYHDKELDYLEEKEAAGIDNLRRQMKNLLGDKLTSVPHELLISRLDEVSRIFNVVILKTTLTIPYTSIFFELDCNYWNNTNEEALQKKIQS
jgi:D-ribose pyranose/furanose isomerase RbsD